MCKKKVKILIKYLFINLYLLAWLDVRGDWICEIRWDSRWDGRWMMGWGI
jgi:hypothetical protein